MAITAYQRLLDARDELRKQLDIALTESLRRSHEEDAPRRRRTAEPPAVRQARRRAATARERLEKQPPRAGQ